MPRKAARSNNTKGYEVGVQSGTYDSDVTKFDQ